MLNLLPPNQKYCSERPDKRLKVGDSAKAERAYPRAGGCAAAPRCPLEVLGCHASWSKPALSPSKEGKEGSEALSDETSARVTWPGSAVADTCAGVGLLAPRLSALGSRGTLLWAIAVLPCTAAARAAREAAAEPRAATWRACFTVSCETCVGVGAPAAPSWSCPAASSVRRLASSRAVRFQNSSSCAAATPASSLP